jgi:PAS domain S-box-containing protein
MDICKTRASHNWREFLIKCQMSLFGYIDIAGRRVSGKGPVLAEAKPSFRRKSEREAPAPEGIAPAISALIPGEAKQKATGAEDKADPIELGERLAKVGYWNWDLRSNKTMWSPETYRIYGFDPSGPPPGLEEVLSRYHPDDAVTLAACVDRAVTLGESYDLEARLIQPNGETRSVISSATALRDGDGRVCLVHGSFQDITDLRLAEASLRQSEARFRGAFETAAQGMALVSTEGKFVKVNQSLCTMLGYTEAELLKKTFQEITHPDDLQSDLNYVESLLQAKINHFDLEKRYFHKNGEAIWVLLSVSLVRDATGSPIHFVSQIQDITERRLAEFRLRRLNHLHTVLGKVGEAIVRTGDRQELFHAVCRILVEYGQLRMAFVAALDAESGAARVVTSHGAGLEHLPEPPDLMVVEGAASDQDTVQTALRTGSPDVCNDIAVASRMKRWRESALTGGLLSNASFPIKLRGAPIAVLALWAGELNYFLEDEISLMTALADNLSLAVDAQEKEQRRQRAEKLSAQLAVIVESSEDAIIGNDLDGMITSWNNGAESIFGYTAEEMLGEAIVRLVPADRLDEENRVLEKVRRGESVRNLETLRLTKSGHPINVSITVSPIKDDSGSPIGASCVARDITQKKVSEARFRRLSDSNVQSIFFWNTKGEITGSNDAFLRLLGYSRDDLEAGSLDWALMTPPEYAAVTQRALEEVAANGICTAYEKEFIRKDGTRTPILIGGATFEDNPDEGVCFVFDLTERKELERQLRQSQKMESLGQLTGGIAHDFNNLLAITQLNIEFIRELLPEDAEIRNMADMALHATKRGANLTQQLLAFARKQPLQPRSVNLDAVVSGTVSLLRPMLGETITITAKLPVDLWTTTIDPNKLEAALVNLAVNSLHAMPDGGGLIIEAFNIVVDKGYMAKHPGLEPGDYVLLSVSDTGTGMSAAVLEHALEPFFTTKPVGKGSGLGLSMVLGFVKQSGGHLRISSEPGRGSTVSLYLPRASADEIREAAAQDEELPSSAGDELILVVEDDQTLRNLMLRILSSAGYRTIAAEDGPDACDKLESIDRVDLLLTDVVLPKGINGQELARKVRSRQPAAKVLYMSGYPRDALDGDGRLENQASLLTKPFSKDELVQMVRSVLDDRTESYRKDA